MRKSTILMRLSLILLCAFSASAQQPANLQVERGSVTISEVQFPQASYEFTGGGTIIRGYIPGGDGLSNPTCSPCVGGNEVAISAFFSSERVASVTVNEVTRDLYVRSNLTLTGQNVTIPNRSGRVYITVTVPATLTGSLVGYATNPNAPGPVETVFTTPLNLRGYVTLSLTYYGELNGKPQYSARQVTYVLQESQSAPPEK